jgi:IS4 transposase
MDSWFASKENFEFIVRKGKDFIAAVKSNRLFAVSLEDKLNGRFERVGALGLKDKESVRGYIRGYDKEVILTCQVFTSKDGSTGRLYLVSSDTTLSDVYIFKIYQRRWKVEEYYKSLKANAALAKLPTKRETTQISYLVMSMIAVFKLECLKIKQYLNHFALRSKVLIKSNFAAMTELDKLKCA